MSNETNTSPDRADDGQNEQVMSEYPPVDTPAAPPSAPRDIIAERLAQRMKEREALQAAEPPKQEEPSAEAPKLERKILNFEPKESAPKRSLQAEDISQTRTYS